MKANAKVVYSAAQSRLGLLYFLPTLPTFPLAQGPLHKLSPRLARGGEDITYLDAST